MSSSRAPAGPRRLSACLPDHLRIALSRRVDADSRLRHAWHACVTEPLASHAWPVRFSDGVLYVHVDTPAWASRVRYQQPALLALLRRNPLLADLSGMRVRVVPVDPPSTNPSVSEPSQPARASPEAVKGIERTAATVRNAGLRAALERLARSAAGAPPKRRP